MTKQEREHWLRTIRYWRAEEIAALDYGDAETAAMFAATIEKVRRWVK